VIDPLIAVASLLALASFIGVGICSVLLKERL
jgi:hypothetical protein